VEALTNDLKGQPRQEFVTVLAEALASEGIAEDKKEVHDENHTDQKDSDEHSTENETTTEGH
jgi:hypothetical protein